VRGSAAAAHEGRRRKPTLTITIELRDNRAAARCNKSGKSLKSAATVIAARRTAQKPAAKGRIFEEYPECSNPCISSRLESGTLNSSQLDTKNMSARRPFESLDVLEIRRLLELAIEAGLHTADFSPLLLRAYGALAAEFGFELWSREQACLQIRHACGRSAGQGYLPHRARGH